MGTQRTREAAVPSWDTHETREGNWEPLPTCHLPSSGQLAGMGHMQLLSTGQSPGWLQAGSPRHQGLSPRRESQGCQGLGLLHRYSGRKAGWKQGTAPSTRKTASLFSGTRKHCTQPTHRTALEPSLQQEKNAGFGVLPSTAVAGAEEQQELQAPTMAHCAMHNKHLASCAVICGQTLALAATELGKGQRVKDKPWEQKQS